MRLNLGMNDMRRERVNEEPHFIESGKIDTNARVVLKPAGVHEPVRDNEENAAIDGVSIAR